MLIFLVMPISVVDIDMCFFLSFAICVSQAHAHYGFGELAFYLSMNYFDRFLSFFELPVSSNQG